MSEKYLKMLDGWVRDESISAVFIKTMLGTGFLLILMGFVMPWADQSVFSMETPLTRIDFLLLVFASMMILWSSYYSFMIYIEFPYVLFRKYVQKKWVSS